MSDINISSLDNQRTLDDLKKEQEQKLQKLRADYQKRADSEQQTGEAAISHIKKSNEERIDHLQSDNDSKIRRESDLTNKNYIELKHRTAQQTEALRAAQSSTEERAEHSISAAQKNEVHAEKQSQEQFKEFIERQKEQREQAQQDAVKGIDETRKTASQKITQTKAQADHQLAIIAVEDQRRLDALKAQDGDAYRTTHERDTDQIERIKNLDKQSFDHERERDSASLTETQRKYREALNIEQKSGEQRLTLAEKQNMQKFQEHRDRAIRTNQLSQAEYSAEGQRVQVEGENDIHQRQAHFQELKKEQEKSNTDELNKVQTQLSEGELKARNEALQKMKAESKKLNQTMHAQRTEFQKRYDLGDQTNKESYRNQKDVYLQELYKQKQKFDSRFDVNAARKDDPFYQLKTFSPRLVEQEKSYVLTAKVAPHERESVDIVVKDDHISLSAKRAYQDSFTDESGEKTATNTYQTYRQDFKLDVPVEGKKAFRKIDDEGNITVIVPKKGSGEKTSKG